MIEDDLVELIPEAMLLSFRPLDCISRCDWKYDTGGVVGVVKDLLVRHHHLVVRVGIVAGIEVAIPHGKVAALYH